MKVWLWTLVVAILAGLAYGLNAGWAEADEPQAETAPELEAAPATPSQETPKLSHPVAPSAPVRS